MNYDLQQGKSPAIPVGSLVLVTGISGFVASHVADQLLKAGYRVRGTTRDEEKAEWVREVFGERYGQGKVETVVVADMKAEGAFDEACRVFSSKQGVSGVAHVASDMAFSSDPNKIIPMVIAGAVNAASAAAKEPSVQRFVYTSSSTAITSPKLNREFTISVDQWNDEDVAKAWAPPPYHEDRAMCVYGASKTQAEKAMWEFVRERKPGFVLNTVLPNLNMGTVLSERQSGSTAGLLRQIYETGELEKFNRFPPQWMVNVADTARVHVAALIDPGIR
ncbi:MAG: hypothetical protein Q9182_004227, partial [Xanthomendoza sp. 2 TL-2023]